jgi:transcriptional regulatory protein RtcR
MKSKKRVVFSILGSTLDAGRGPKRWEKWRPTIALCQHDDLLIDRLELIYERKHQSLAETVIDDLRRIAPETEIVPSIIQFSNPWDFEEVYAVLADLARGYSFRTDDEEYLIHITTGTHVAQICWFLLTESRYFPGRLLQISPRQKEDGTGPGSYAIIDLDLSKYDSIASRFQQEQRQALSFLKAGIDTRNAAFNHLIERIEKVAMASVDPILLMGPTGAGKSQLAKRIYELKKERRQVTGEFTSINCATLRGDTAMATLFGHTRGAFTGAVTDRPGLLRKANGGVLFLDEIGELGLDEQAMLLRAIEEKLFYPVGSDKEVKSDFQLLAGTNRNLNESVHKGKFREDLLARINLWSFRLPGLKDRSEDIAPNLEYELTHVSQKLGMHVTFNQEGKQLFLNFATSPEALWLANFRDFNAAMIRMATLAPGARITVESVQEEIERLQTSWQSSAPASSSHAQAGISLLDLVMDTEQIAQLDRFDRSQLDDVVHVCKQARSLSEAGRILFSESRKQKSSVNDADRLRKYLARFQLDWKELRQKLNSSDSE